MLVSVAEPIASKRITDQSNWVWKEKSTSSINSTPTMLNLMAMQLFAFYWDVVLFKWGFNIVTRAARNQTADEANFNGIILISFAFS